METAAALAAAQASSVNDVTQLPIGISSLTLNKFSPHSFLIVRSSFLILLMFVLGVLLSIFL